MTDDRTHQRAPVALDREDAAAPAIDADHDEGVGNVRPEEVTPLDPDDEGIGNVRPAEIEPLPPTDEGVGSVRPEDAPAPDPADEGLGSTDANG